MLNLILKDILIQKNILIIYIATIILYLMVNVPSVYIVFIYSIVFVLSAFSNDEKDNANILLNSLPYTRKEIVSSKYIGALIFTGLFMFLTYLFDFLLNGNQVAVLWKEVLLIMGLVMIVISFILPISYKFKTKYLTIAIMGLFGVYMVIINYFVPNINKQIRTVVQNFMTVQELQLYLIVSLLIVVLYIGSWMLSVRIYKRKAF
ncbi:ABC-2 transporter permease [Lysinibacillus fusiformis]|uniref:ABC-2 transporter permease n=1 Tax=Lysinibacillus fusiformis TaxID=28031 RepID=UPI0002FA3944|nr:ABC-2 transporter permease [Lysinibacillus fusiformis]MCG7437629.1 ABC-2 transporter permease [Lysinibacillus fusiformis]MED4076853.1 ABC-2 transporter permease [Lysinibacillus fusiformis]PCD81014.1 ABC-2 transporter permease [Lysinibacillus fusiformis]